MTRRETWPNSLALEYSRLARESFQWGQFDCALAACSVIEAMTGVDPAANLRGTYSTQLGAVRAIKDAGFDSLEDLADGLAEKHGVRPIDWRQARRGDLVLADGDRGPMLGICVGATAAFAAEPRGWRQLPMDQIRRAWRI